MQCPFYRSRNSVSPCFRGMFVVEIAGYPTHVARIVYFPYATSLLTLSQSVCVCVCEAECSKQAASSTECARGKVVLACECVTCVEYYIQPQPHVNLSAIFIRLNKLNADRRGLL